jgi:hypothetical protein
MPDISMCQNKDCSLRLSCHRYTATPNIPAQCYGDFAFENGKCYAFWDNTGYENEEIWKKLSRAVRPPTTIEACFSNESLALEIWMYMDDRAKQQAMDMAVRQGENHPSPETIFVCAELFRNLN